MMSKIFKIIKRVFLTALVVFLLFVIWLVIWPFRDAFGLFIYRVNDTTLIAVTMQSAYYLTGITHKIQEDTLVIHSYSKFVYFTMLPSSRKARRGIVLKHPVKYVRYREEIYPFDRLHIYNDRGYPDWKVDSVLKATVNRINIPL